MVVFTVVPRMDEVAWGSCKGSSSQSIVWRYGGTARTLATSLGFTSPLYTFPGVLAVYFLTSAAGKFNNSWLT